MSVWRRCEGGREGGREGGEGGGGSGFGLCMAKKLGGILK